jgi:hypothetical protein
VDGADLLNPKNTFEFSDDFIQEMKNHNAARNENKPLSRRQFVRTAAAGVTLPWIIPASVLGAQAPSNRITAGFIGTGVHGTEWNLMSYLWRYNNRVLVVCDVDGHHMRRAKKLVAPATTTKTAR